MKSIYEYKNIVIDTDLEPDDKAALELFFRGLAERKASMPDFEMPKITIMTGSTTRPSLKTLQLKKMIENFQCANIEIDIIQASATSKKFPKDGYDLLDASVVDAVKEEPAFRISEENLQKISNILQQKNSVFVCMREVGDLCLILDKTKQKLPADFMGTLSFNVSQPFRNIEGGATKFVNDYLSRFNDTLCFDSFNSARDNNSTGEIWPQLREIIAQNHNLLRAHQLWDEDNIEDCYRTLSDANHIDNKTEILGLTPEQASNANNLFKQVLKNRDQGIYQALSIDEIKQEIAKFKDSILAAFGTDAQAKINVADSKAQQAFKFNFNPFVNMVFFAPQLCLADICFMAVVTNPELLKASMKPKSLSYNGRFSKFDANGAPNTNYIMLSAEQLKAAGDYVCNLLEQETPKYENRKPRKF